MRSISGISSTLEEDVKSFDVVSAELLVVVLVNLGVDLLKEADLGVNLLEGILVDILVPLVLLEAVFLSVLSEFSFLPVENLSVDIGGYLLVGLSFNELLELPT
ncbi:MAG: hypothetical protein QXM53_09210 [Thermofilaceae archaeon]